jgi:hypothetical protein
MKKLAALCATLILANLLTNSPAHAAQADTVRKYGILSLAGDAISTITYVPDIGTRINPNDKLVYPMLANTMFDETAIRAASAAVKVKQADAAPFLMLSTDAELHQMQNAMFDDPAANQANRDYLKSLWKDKGITHLILVTKFNAEIEVKYFQESDLSGKAEGLGFYMDNKSRLVSNNHSTQGLLMPFAYIKLRLINADTLAVENEVRQKQSVLATYAPGADRAVRTWDALTPKQKMDYLDELMQIAVTEGVPKLLAK